MFRVYRHADTLEAPQALFGRVYVPDPLPAAAYASERR